MSIQIGRLFDHRQQVGNRDLAEDMASTLGMTHVALDESGVSPADLGQRLAGGKMDYLIHVQAFVRLTPTKNRNVQHAWYPQNNFLHSPRRPGPTFSLMR